MPYILWANIPLGVCYLLGAELNQMGTLNQCASLPKKDRVSEPSSPRNANLLICDFPLQHNDYAACEQGFSAFIDRNVTLTGLPGARKWTGGVFGEIPGRGETRAPALISEVRVRLQRFLRFGGPLDHGGG